MICPTYHLISFKQKDPSGSKSKFLHFLTPNFMMVSGFSWIWYHTQIHFHPWYQWWFRSFSTSLYLWFSNFFHWYPNFPLIFHEFCPDPQWITVTALALGLVPHLWRTAGPARFGQGLQGLQASNFEKRATERDGGTLGEWIILDPLDIIYVYMVNLWVIYG